jgi:hypothetical protein
VLRSAVSRCITELVKIVMYGPAVNSRVPGHRVEVNTSAGRPGFAASIGGRMRRAYGVA